MAERKARKEVEKRWETAERGEDGLRRIRWADFVLTATTKYSRYLTEPVVITADGIEKCVIMSYDQFLALIESSLKPPREPQMRRVKGKMEREVWRNGVFRWEPFTKG